MSLGKNKMTPQCILLYPYISAWLNHITEASYSRWEIIKKTTNRQCAENYALEALSYKQDFLIKFSLSRLKCVCIRGGRKIEEAEVIKDSKETLSSRHKWTDAHKNSYRLWRTPKTCTDTIQADIIAEKEKRT